MLVCLECLKALLRLSPQPPIAIMRNSPHSRSINGLSAFSTRSTRCSRQANNALSRSSVDSKETPYRYAGYANRLRTVLLSAHRYVAYTSDIGESFRPVAHPYLVRTAYAVSWTYLIGDVVHEGYKAYLRNRRVLAPPGEAYKDAKDLSQQDVVKGMATGNVAGSLRAGEPTSSSNSPAGSSSSDTLTPWPTTEIPLIEDYRMVMAKRAVFQSIASMGLPAFTIHSVVKYSGRMLKNSKMVFLRTWAPIGVSLCSTVHTSMSTRTPRFCGVPSCQIKLTPPPPPPPSSSVSPSSPSSLTSSTSPSTKPSSGPSAPLCAPTPAKPPSAPCLPQHVSPPTRPPRSVTS